MSVFLIRVRLFFKALSSLIYDFKGGSVSACDVVLFDGDESRNILLDNKLYSPFVDSVGDYLENDGMKCRTIVTKYSRNVGKGVMRFPISINIWHFLSVLTKTLFNNNLLIFNKYIEIIKLFGCKAIIGVTPDASLCRAGKTLGIPVFELLHGMGYQEEYFKKHYIDVRSDSEIPDYFICFDKVTKSSLLSHFSEDRIIGLEHHFVSRFGDNSTLPIPKSWRVPSTVLKQMRKYKKTVLVSLQWGMDGEYELLKGVLENGIIHEAVIRAIEESEKNILWVIRLHPVQLTTPYVRHKRFIESIERKYRNVIFEELINIPLPEILNVCDSHITASSMVCYEAAWSGVVSYAFLPLLRVEGSEYISYYKDLEKKGFVVKDDAEKNKIVNFVESTERTMRLPFEFKDDIAVVKKLIKEK